MSVRHVCVHQVDLTVPEDSVQTAARRMHDRKVGSLVVCGSAGQPVGILTDRDLAIRVVAAGRDPIATTVAEIMTKSPQCIHESEPMENALSIMRSVPCRRLPVVDDQDQLIGIVSLDDILGVLSEEFREIGTLLWNEKPESLASL